jgi:hypothetical protein
MSEDAAKYRTSGGPAILSRDMARARLPHPAPDRSDQSRID